MSSLIGKKFPVLNDGFIRVVDIMGGDSDILDAARISYSKGITKRSGDRVLLRYLMRHHHTTPFEMCKLKLHVRVPMDTWRQWIRHRTANVNEYSTRYSEAIDSCQTTKPTEWRLQSSTNKQGSEEFLDEQYGLLLTRREKAFHEAAKELYQERLSLGVAREQARKDLPLSTYTEAFWCMDLKNLLNFLRLRMESHAQLEIREYANTIGEQIVKEWCPETWKAFKLYTVDSMSLSNGESSILPIIIRDDGIVSNHQALQSQNFLTSKGKLNREGQGFAIKYKRITGEELTW